MKKIYLLIAVAFLTISASAQNVILRLDNNYDVSIDGRNYEGNATIPNLGYGTHTVNVYEVKRGFLGIGKRRTLVSSSDFELRNNDVMINVDQSGRLRINQVGKDNSRRYDRNRDRDRDRDYGRNDDRDDDRDEDRNYDRNDQKKGRGYGPYNNPGKGNKYGLYKDKKHKSQKAYKRRGNK